MKTLFPIAMVAAIFAASAFIYCIPSGGRATAAEPTLFLQVPIFHRRHSRQARRPGPRCHRILVLRCLPTPVAAPITPRCDAAAGPFTEAFATPLEVNPQPGPVIKKEPPPAIEEMPPDQKPDGDNVVWIPGYFSWKTIGKISFGLVACGAMCRPTKRGSPAIGAKCPRAISGRPGFWTSAKKAEVNYLPAPPQSLEVGPNISAPSGNFLLGTGHLGLS